MTAAPARTAIRVITLSTSIARHEAFQQMALDCNLEWAFTSASTEPIEPLRYNPRTASRRCGRPISPEEIGCYASHFKLWERLAGSDYDQALFEDDALVDWGIVGQLAETPLAKYGINVLRLYIPRPFKFNVVKYRMFSQHSHLLRAKGLTFGALAYALTREAARLLSSKYSVVVAPVDWVLAWYWEHRLPTYCLFPFPAIERFGPSTIGTHRFAVSARSFFIDRVVRFGWRMRDCVLRAYVDNGVFEKYPLRPQNEGPIFVRRVDPDRQAP